MFQDYLLIILITLPLVFAAAVALGPKSRSFSLAAAGTLLSLVIGLFALLLFQWDYAGTQQLSTSVKWFPMLGFSLSVGVDSISLLLILLTLGLGPICVFASRTAITTREKTYYAWLLVLQGAMVGVFAARDLVFFYICFEFTLVPMYVLINLFGSTNRARAATKFFLYTFTGSLIALAGLVYIAWKHASTSGAWSFDITTLELAARQLSTTEQSWCMAAMLLGFAVKVPVFPFHTWLPLAHTEAPTAGSVILAGVLLKLGTYGILRFVLGFTPEAVVLHAPLIAVLAVIGIIYGGLVCWVQSDVKKLVAYSSVAHLGFCILGMFALNHTGIAGSVLYMINHGLSTGALFLLIGMIYERYHTRDMNQLGGLAAKMPIWATFMVFFAMASVGLPGLNGFVSEFMCLMGTFQSSSHWYGGLWGIEPSAAGDAAIGATRGELGPAFAAVAGTGMIIAAIYLLYMVGKVVFGPLKEPAGHDHHGDGHDHGPLPADLTGREIGVLAPLAVACIALGVYPSPVLDGIKQSVTASVSTVDSARSRLIERGVLPPVQDRTAARRDKNRAESEAIQRGSGAEPEDQMPHDDTGNDEPAEPASPAEPTTDGGSGR